LNINGPLPFTTLFLVITEPINGRSYDFGAIPYVGTTIYNPVTQLFYYIASDGSILNGYPSAPVEMLNGTNLKSSSLVQFMNSAPSEAYIPLQFWFCRNPGLALPLIALQYHEIKLNLQLATWQELHAGSYSEIDLSSIKVYAEYVYLDSVERRHFTNNAHEYLIEQLQFDTFNNSFANNLSGGALQIDLNFSNCVKEIVFCGTPIAYGIASQGIATPNDILNSKAETSNVEVQLKINQANRFSNRNIKYFTRNQIWDCHTGSGSCNGYEGQVGTDNIGIYSFSLRPEEHQPSGTCNFSRISKPQLVFSNFNLANGEQINSLNIYAVSYNILRIMSGMGNIAYAY
jgi:Large eukaryotic DNA virus major capsid protein/Major capsid protein N-terminus